MIIEIHLRRNSTHYADAYSRVDWPLAVGTPLYVQADAYSMTDDGVVRERHEILGTEYNNISGPFYVGGSGE